MIRNTIAWTKYSNGKLVRTSFASSFHPSLTTEKKIRFYWYFNLFYSAYHNADAINKIFSKEYKNDVVWLSVKRKKYLRTMQNVMLKFYEEVLGIFMELESQTICRSHKFLVLINWLQRGLNWSVYPERIPALLVGVHHPSKAKYNKLIPSKASSDKKEKDDDDDNED